MTRLFYIAFFLLPFTCAANFKVSGKIVNTDDDKPITNATVFLNNTLISAATGIDGSFVFNDVKQGEYNLIVALKGCNTYQRTVFVTDALLLPDIGISINAIPVSEKMEGAVGWAGNYQIFKHFLLGESAFTDQCKILNPEILQTQFDSITMILTVKLNGLLVIENQALGYRLKYLLTNFSYYQKSAGPELAGNLFFEEMEGSPAQKAAWQTKRLNIYEGSSMQFLRSIIKDQSRKAGFSLFRLIKKSQTMKKKKAEVDQPVKFKVLGNLEIHDMTKRTVIKGRFALKFADSLYVTFRKEKNDHITDPTENSFTTIISLISPYTYFDDNGIIINPGSLVFKGYWKERPLSESIPFDFDPQLRKNVVE